MCSFRSLYHVKMFSKYLKPFSMKNMQKQHFRKGATTYAHDCTCSITLNILFIISLLTKMQQEQYLTVHQLVYESYYHILLDMTFQQKPYENSGCLVMVVGFVFLGKTIAVGKVLKLVAERD